MPKAARLGDIASGHGCFPPSPVTSASSDVFINGIPAARMGDSCAVHGCKDCPPHGRNIAAGSSTVFINGKPAARVGDSITCGGSISAGSGNVFIGSEGNGFSINSMASSISNSTTKEITSIYFSYSEMNHRISNYSRHYIDLNLHVNTVGYTPGETITITLEGAISKAVSGKVNENGEVLIPNIIKNDNIEMEGVL